MNIEQSIHARLAADPAVTALVGDRIYPCRVPDDEPTQPWLYFIVAEAKPASDSLTESGQLMHYTVDFAAFCDFDHGYGTVRQIADALRASLDTYRGGQIQRAFWTGTSFTPIEEGYQATVTFSVWGYEALVLPAEGGLPRVLVTSDGLFFDGQQLGEGDKHYTHTQSTPSTTWSVTHNLGKYPTVNILDSAGTEVLGNITHNSLNALTVTLSQAVAGKCICN